MQQHACITENCSMGKDPDMRRHNGFKMVSGSMEPIYFHSLKSIIMIDKRT